MRSLIIAGLLVTLLAAAAQAEDGSMQLSLKEAIKLAVEKNLDVKAELYNPASSEADIHKFSGIYDPLLSILTSLQDSNTLPASTFLSGSSVNRQKTLKYNAGATQLVPVGGTLGLAFNNTWIENNSDPERFLNLSLIHI